jgi:hypothetical protein
VVSPYWNGLCRDIIQAQLLDLVLKFRDLTLELRTGARTFESAVDELNPAVPVHKNGRGVSEEMIDLRVDLFLDVVVIEAAAKQ